MFHDFNIAPNGALIMVLPITNEAVDWTALNIPDEALYCGSAFAVEPSNLPGIIAGITHDGLTINH